MLRVLGSTLLRSPCRFLTTKKYDPFLVEQIKKKIDEEKTFQVSCWLAVTIFIWLTIVLQNFYVDDFAEIYGNDHSKKAKIEKIIHTYDNMKYNLEDVPTILSKSDMSRLLELETLSDIKRLLNKLQFREFEYLLRKELKNTTKTEVNKDSDNGTSLDRSGLFDADGDLRYG